MNKYILFINSIFLPILLFSQGPYILTANNNSNDTVTICQGDSIQLNLLGVNVYLLNEDFNNQSMGSFLSGNGTPNYNSPCSSNGIDGTPVCWVGDNFNSPRNLTTIPLSITSNGQLCFDFSMATQGDLSPCEGPDEMDEGVSIQYSKDNGNTWYDITYLCPDGNEYATNSWIGQSTAGGGFGTPFNEWANYCYDIPPAAYSWHTSFRWHQDMATSFDMDHWGIDNLNLYLPQYDSIIWNNGTTNFSSGQIPPPQYISGDTTFYVTLYDSSTVYSDSIHINVLPRPNILFEMTDTAFCQHDLPVNLNASPPGGVYSGNGINNITFNPYLAGGGQHNLYYVYSETNTCLDSALQEVFVYAPSSDFSIDSTVCINSIINAQYNGAITDTNLMHWELGSAIVNPPYNYSYLPLSWDSPGIHDLSLFIQDSTCFSDTTKQYITVIDTFSSNFIVDDLLTCTGINDSLYYIGNASGDATFNWDHPGANAYYSGTSELIYVSYDNPGTYDISLSVVQGQCSSDTTSATIEVFQSSVSDFSITGSYCIGDTIIAEYNGFDPTIVTYNWDFGNSNIISGTQNGPYYITPQDTFGLLVSLYVENMYSCISDISYEFAHYLQCLPTTFFTYIINNNVVNFTNQSLYSTSYNWDFGDGNNSILSNPVHIYAAPGTYIVELKALNNYGEDIYIDTLDIITVSHNKLNTSNIRVYPNPFNNYIKVEQNIINSTIAIIDIYGNTIHESVLTRNLQQIDLKNIKSGVYFIKIQTPDNMIIRKIIKQ